jgi:hypothetical protein
LKINYQLYEKQPVKKMISITAHTLDKAQIKAIKAMLTAFKVRFEIAIEKQYNPNFIAKIRLSETQAKRGKVKRVKKEDINDFLSL